MSKNNRISKLITQPVGNKYSTEELIGCYKALLNFDTIQQIEHLGVKGRWLKDEYASSRDACIEAGLAVDSPDVVNLIVASEIWEYQTPGIASTLITPLGLSHKVNVYNLQGTACSSMPKILSLCEQLEGDTLVIINGITSPMYQRKLNSIKEEIQPKTDDWVALMFAFLFGDGVASFVVGREGEFKFKMMPHVSNLSSNDWKEASVRLSNPFTMSANKDVVDTALRYTDYLIAESVIDMGDYDKIILHTGSHKIIEAYKDHYKLNNGQLQSARYVLEHYGNLTGCSLPFVLGNGFFEKGLMIGISMGFSVDMVEIKTT